jgi:hypothetical protein
VSQRQTSIMAGAAWMLVISLILFWLPFIGPLVGGIVGGRKAGGVGSALVAALLPAIVVGIMLLVFGTMLTGMPLIGAIAGAGGFILVAAQVGPLLLGAVLGGLMA